MSVPDTFPARRWPARLLIAALMAPTLAACWLAAKATYDVATDRFLGFTNPWVAGALLAVAVLALGAVVWLLVVAWNGTPPQRTRRIVASALACMVLWAAAVILALSVLDYSY